MAVQKFEDFEDECANCGSSPYQHSRTNGLCVDCNPTDPRYANQDDGEEAQY